LIEAGNRCFHVFSAIGCGKLRSYIIFKHSMIVKKNICLFVYNNAVCWQIFHQSLFTQPFSAMIFGN